MSPNSKNVQRRTYALEGLRNAYTDFIVSRQAMQCTQATHNFYKHTAGKFLLWLEQNNVTHPEEVNARLVRQYLAELVSSGKKDTTIHAHARAVRTLLRFWYKEKYMQELVTFDMPRLSKKRLPVLSVEQLQQVLRICNVRDKAIVMFMVDSGLRRSEVINLNWGDVDFMNGLVQVKQGKGKKDRSVVIGAQTRRAVLAYKRAIDHADTMPLFQSRTRQRFTGHGFLIVFRRLSQQSGIHITPHALRRTFVILSLRSEMSVLHLQAMLGHESLGMVYHYAQMSDEDLIAAHRDHGPIDNLPHISNK